MPIDGYSPCPGGLAKKIKFCCPDLVQELAKIERMREGDQTIACLDVVERLDARHPGRACLLAAKADLLRELGRTAEADQAVQGLIEKGGGDNPVALSEATLLACQHGEAEEAVRLFQQALSAVALEQPWPESMYEALPAVSVRLLNEGYWLAARAHLSLQMAINREDQGAMELLVSLNQSAGLPLLLKQVPEIEECREQVPWADEFNQANTLARHARWLDAADQLSALAKRGVDHPLLWRNLAVLRARVADEAAACEAYRRLAASSLPLDDAVEAEALAQLLDPELDTIDTLRIIYPVTDLERLQEVMLSDARCEAVRQLPPGDENEPPPKAGFTLLDRPRLTASEGLTLETLPQVLGSVMLYGKQTDRDARLELFCWRPERRAAAHALLTNLGFGLLGNADAGEPVDETTIDSALLEVDYQFPADTPLDVRYDLGEAIRHRALSKDWPNFPRPSLAGKSPAQAAADPAGRIAALACLLRLELQCDGMRLQFDSNALRSQLGLPLPEPLVVGDRKVTDLPAVRLKRLVWSQLSDEQLKQLLPMGRLLAAHTVTRMACQELLSRLGDKEPYMRAELLTLLAGETTDTRKSLELIDQARELAVAARHSSGEWDLIELRLRLARGEVEHFNRLMEHLMSEHMEEPHIRQQLTQLLVQMGLIRPDGTIVQRSAGEAAATPAPVEEASKLWTPESARGGEKKSLWVPD